jgi:hypothetical protein
MPQARVTITTTMRYSLSEGNLTNASTEGRNSAPSTAVAATVPADPNSGSYQQGSAARDSWEAWFNGLTGSEREGAYYWAGQRRLKAPVPCSAHASNGDDWLSGCTEAKRRLTPVDIKRNTDPQYWNGWNKIGVASPPAQNQEAEPTKRVEPAPPNVAVFQLPPPDKCPAFAASYKDFQSRIPNGTAAAVWKADEAVVFRRYFNVDVDSASENDLRSMFSWINKCEGELRELSRLNSNNSRDWTDLSMANPSYSPPFL